MLRLTAEEIAYFKANGYVIKRNVLNPALCSQAQDLLWDALPSSVSLARDDPATHVGPFRESDSNSDPKHLRVGFQWRLRAVESHPTLVRLAFTQPLRGMVEQLLGPGMLHVPSQDHLAAEGLDEQRNSGAVHTGIRGIYCTLPYGDAARRAPGFHTDGHPFFLGMVGLPERRAARWGCVCRMAKITPSTVSDICHAVRPTTYSSIRPPAQRPRHFSFE